jgi:hypothetical protein
MNITQRSVVHIFTMIPCIIIFLLKTIGAHHGDDLSLFFLILGKWEDDVIRDVEARCIP